MLLLITGISVTFDFAPGVVQLRKLTLTRFIDNYPHERTRRLLLQTLSGHSVLRVRGAEGILAREELTFITVHRFQVDFPD